MQKFDDCTEIIDTDHDWDAFVSEYEQWLYSKNNSIHNESSWQKFVVEYDRWVAETNGE